MSILRLNGTSGYTEITAPTSAGNNRLTLPTSNGSNGQSIITNGSGALSFQWDAGTLFYRLNADLVGSNSASPAQKIFGVGVTLAASTVYSFIGLYVFSKTVGSTSHDFRVGWSLSTATVNNIILVGNAVRENTAISTDDTTPVAFVHNGTGNTRVANPSSSIFTLAIQVSGTVSVNAGGIAVPTYDLTVAPGGAYSTVAGSYIAFTPIGAAGSNSSQGTWS